MPDDLTNRATAPPEYAAMRGALLARLNAVRRSIRVALAAEAAARVAATLVGLATLTLLLDWQLELSLIARLCTAIVAAALVGYLVYRWLVHPLSLPLPPIEVAAALDSARRADAPLRIAPRVASVLQLPEYLSQPGDSSPALIERAVQRSYDALQPVDFRAALNRRRLTWCLVALGLVIAVPSAFGMVFPSVAGLWAERWFAGSNRPWPRSTTIEVVGVRDGRLIVPRGEPASVQVLVSDAEQATEVVWMRLRNDAGQDETLTLSRFATGDFRYDLPPLQLAADARVWGGDAQAPPFQIVPVDRPKIAALELRSRSPRDSEEVVHTFTGAEGNVRLLPQTRAALTIETNVPVTNVEVETLSGEPLVFRPVDDTHFRAEWTHAVQVQARLILHAGDGEFASHPRGVSIGVTPDRTPRISVRHSGVRLRVTPQATIPLSITARDDFGIRKVDLNVRIPETAGSSEAADDATEQPHNVEPPAPVGESPEANASPATSAADESVFEKSPAPTSRTAEAETTTSDQPREDVSPETRTVYGPLELAESADVDHTLELELGPRNLQPGRTVVLSATAGDDCFTGEQTAQSRQLVLRVVRPDELFREILSRQQQLRARLRKAADQAENLRDRLPTAQIPDAAQELHRTHQLIRREVGNVSRELNESVLEMRLNKLGGEETWRLIADNVLDPLARLYAQEMEQQRLALESQTGPQPDPFEQIIDRQQVIVAAMNAILDNMAHWDSFIDVVNQLNSVIQLEKSVRQKTEELRRTQTESIFDP